MTQQELCLLTFYRYYLQTQGGPGFIYPNLKSIDNLNYNPRIHLQTNSPTDIEAHFNINSVRLTYFFYNEAEINTFEEFIAHHFPGMATPFHGVVGNNTYYFIHSNSASIECHVRFNEDGGGQPDPDSPSVSVLDPGFNLEELNFGGMANDFVDQIIERWKEMIDDLEPFH